MHQATVMSCAGRVRNQLRSDHWEGRQNMRKTITCMTSAAAIVALLAVGCSHSTSHQMTPNTLAVVPRSAGATPTATPAAELRTGLNALLSEHVILAAAATGAAMGERSAEFEAAAGALDANSVDLAKAIGSA